MHHKDYVEKHGDPTTNGLGHTRQLIKGKDVVVIPGFGMGKLVRSDELLADIKTKIADADQQVTGEGEMESMQMGIVAGFSFASTGMSLDSMLAAAPPAARPPPTPDDGAGAGSASDGMNFGWSSSFTSPAKTGRLQEKAPAPSPSTGRATKTATKRGPQAMFESPPVKKTVTLKAEIENVQNGSGKQSPPQVSTGGGSGGAVPAPPAAKAKAGRGRPPRDLCMSADTTLAALKEAPEEDPKIYGKGKGTYGKFHQRLHDDLVAHVKKLGSDAASWEVANQRLRLVASTFEVLKVFWSKGCEHPEFAAVMDSQTHFLSLPPALNDCFPLFWKRARHTLRAQSLTDGDARAFWALFSKTELGKLGVPDADMASEQARMLHNKLVVLTKARW